MNWEIDIPEKVIIIGGQAAGCKTAARLARTLPQCKITVVEKNEIISFGACGLPFYAAGDVDDVLDLAKTPWGRLRDVDFFQKAKGVTVLINTEVTSIDHEKKMVHCQRSDENFELSYDALVLATGSKPVPPPFACPDNPRIGSFLRPEDGVHFRKMAQSGKIDSVAILGGGYIGVELAEAMVSLWGLQTTLLEQEDHLLPKMLDKAISRHLLTLLEKNDVAIKLETTVSAIEISDADLPVVLLNVGSRLNVDYVFLCTGIQPEITLAGTIPLQVGDHGGLLVDEQMKTSVPGVWAVGDCVEIKNLITGRYDWFPLGSLANREGRVAADSIAHRQARFPGAVGTASVQLFDFKVASTGLNGQTAERLGIPYKSVWAAFLDRPDYHPEKKNLFASIIYEPENLRILGFQIAGAGEVTRYVDVMSALLGKSVTAYDLIELEHAYTPPHASPLSPLNHLGAMILAQEKERINSVPPDLAQITEGVLLDVRTEEENEKSPLPKRSLLIPQERIRERLQELDPSSPIHVICRRGPRSFETVRFLKNNGFENVDYVGGGTAMLSSEEGDDETG